MSLPCYVHKHYWGGQVDNWVLLRVQDNSKSPSINFLSLLHTSKCILSPPNLGLITLSQFSLSTAGSGQLEIPQACAGVVLKLYRQACL